MATTASARRKAHRAANSDTMRRLARAGLAAHGAIYVILGVLALFMAFGHSKGETDQRGALQQLAEQPGGRVLLFVLGAGLALYALWGLASAVTGSKTSERVEGGIRALVYAGLAVSAFIIVGQGRTSSQAGKQESTTSKVMQHTGGRWLVGIVGLVVIGVGVVFVYQGVTRKFEEPLDLGAMSPATRRVVETLGLVGSTARGLVVGLAGVLVLVAAIQYDPNKARGIDGALRALRDTPAGPWLLGLVALGLIMFGLFGLSEARYRRP